MAIGAPVLITTATRRNSATNPMVLTIPAGGVAAGHSVIIGMLNFQGVATSALFSTADTAVNSYATDVLVIPGAYIQMTIISAHNIAALSSGNTISITITNEHGGSSDSYWDVAAYDVNPGSGHLALDVTAGTFNDTGTGTGTAANPDSGATGTVAGGNELVFGVLGAYTTATSTISPGSGFTGLDSVDLGSGYSMVMQTMYQLQASASGTYDASGTTNMSTGTFEEASAACAVYKLIAPAFLAPRGLIVANQAVRRASSY